MARIPPPRNEGPCPIHPPGPYRGIEIVIVSRTTPGRHGPTVRANNGRHHTRADSNKRWKQNKTHGSGAMICHPIYARASQQGRHIIRGATCGQMCGPQTCRHVCGPQTCRAHGCGPHVSWSRLWYTQVPARVCGTQPCRGHVRGHACGPYTCRGHVFVVRKRTVVHVVHTPAAIREYGPDVERHGPGAVWCPTWAAGLPTPTTIGCDHS